MKISTMIKLTAFCCLINPLQGMENNNDSWVDISGIQQEKVVLALWVNASGTTDGDTAKSFLLTSTQPCPTLEQAKQYLSNSSGSYFVGRKIPISIQQTPKAQVSTYGYNKIHGPLRVQKVIQALRAFPDKPVTQQYISVWEEVVAAENKQKQDFIAAKNMDKALALHRTYSVRGDADCVGVSLAQELSSETSKGVKEFAAGLTSVHLKGSITPAESKVRDDAAKQSSSPSSTRPTPPASSSSERNDDLSAETQKTLAPGLKKMFGGK